MNSERDFRRRRDEQNHLVPVDDLVNERHPFARNLLEAPVVDLVDANHRREAAAGDATRHNLHEAPVVDLVDANHRREAAAGDATRHLIPWMRGFFFLAIIVMVLVNAWRASGLVEEVEELRQRVQVLEKEREESQIITPQDGEQIVGDPSTSANADYPHNWFACAVNPFRGGNEELFCDKLASVPSENFPRYIFY